MERTLSIIKPDATKRNLTGLINSVIEKNNLKIVAQKRIKLSIEQAKSFYDIHNEDEGFFKPFPKNDIYSWYKGNIFPDDMGKKILRPDCKICLFNNSYVWKDKAEHMNQIDEIKRLW